MIEAFKTWRTVPCQRKSSRHKQPVSKRKIHRAPIGLGAIIAPVPVVLDVPFFPFSLSELDRQKLGQLLEIEIVLARGGGELCDDIVPFLIAAEVRVQRIVSK